MSQRNGPDLATLLGLGLAIAALLVVGLGLGWLVDLAFGTFPAFALVGLAFGIVGACAYMYSQFKRLLKD